MTYAMQRVSNWRRPLACVCCRRVSTYTEGIDVSVSLTRVFVRRFLRCTLYLKFFIMCVDLLVMVSGTTAGHKSAFTSSSTRCVLCRVYGELTSASRSVTAAAARPHGACAAGIWSRPQRSRPQRSRPQRSKPHPSSQDPSGQNPSGQNPSQNPTQESLQNSIRYKNVYSSVDVVA